MIYQLDIFSDTGDFVMAWHLSDFKLWFSSEIHLFLLSLCSNTIMSYPFFCLTYINADS